MKHNHIAIIGAVPRAPEYKTVGRDLAILNFEIAGKDTVYDAEGNPKLIPWYHEVSVYGALADRLKEQMAAGSIVRLEGSLDYRAWEKDGKKQSRLSIKADSVFNTIWGEDELEQNSNGAHITREAHYNVVQITGKLGKDPEQGKSENSPMTLLVAVEEYKRDASGNQTPKTHWVTVKTWDTDMIALLAGASKGTRVAVHGSLRSDRYETKENGPQKQTYVDPQAIEILPNFPGAAGNED
ncbi:single-stranded DNA-binding protein [Deinococcus soli (ex Cha et al. 2016)]|uniref:Single-stranded DNA-binding protein n=2 Tax=Deinococcus soli (ex Cha et al. 2016) TaxID=1309411 RepID=A0AAE3XCL3_9DEIO|nr:single-stranded DNA-binding protein [Deinococcus soli (ex Cha et al. 2016)]MDR6218459.1 single stranded DNA-binding protein [Deinococcus soli (ex Cha et al. 2016)]MDR6329199.1 single stranded DNA-binding protein [Deinococcus soli (ex Cha et al. 2016)]MDR6751472.1 single stranded DNA-binding protein [Deinococcus soli (ex Cha et al. 2016)]